MQKLNVLVMAVLTIVISTTPVIAIDISGGKLPTIWSTKVTPTNALPDYPRPQMVRKEWENLNGIWNYALTHKDEKAYPAVFPGQILVPFPWESPLSGVYKPSIPDQRLWYRRTFTIPKAWSGKKVLLHFGAVNWDSTIFLNGKQIDAHRGGYDAFTIDITNSLKPERNELIVSAWSPLDEYDGQVKGKQVVHPGGNYTAATGIWQTVWIEPVPRTYISGVKIVPDIDTKSVHIRSEIDGGQPTSVLLSATDPVSGHVVALAKGKAGSDIVLPINNPRLWTPDHPFLYNLRIKLEGRNTDDSVASYFGMRKISLGEDARGHRRIMLNNKPIFQIGVLDQGYWPDGIYTAPTDEALRFDIVAMKRLGMNVLRKHAKVEPQRWYYWTDRLGMLVWQDMPQQYENNPDEETSMQFKKELAEVVEQHYNSPSIIIWTIFNESWGVHDVQPLADLVKRLDRTRLVNANSGGNAKEAGDIADTHEYIGPWDGKPSADASFGPVGVWPARQAAVSGEFGGIPMIVPGHMWAKDSEIHGYGGNRSSRWALTRTYQSLLKKVYQTAEAQGTNAFIYTQLTDVEREGNGLLTYDRKILKPLSAIVLAADHGQFPPMPLKNGKSDLVSTSDSVPQTWRYTTDQPTGSWTQAAFDDSAWKTGLAPFGNDADDPNSAWKSSDIWIRRSVVLPTIIPQRLNIDIFHDDDAEVYINGVLALKAPEWVGEYVSLPMTDAARLTLKPGSNIIAVHCHNAAGAQAIDVGIGQN